MITAFLATALALAPLSPPQDEARERGQTGFGHGLVDHDYSFELTGSKNWRILDEDAVKGFNPDAVAGLAGVGTETLGAFLIVIPEPLFGAYDLEAYEGLVSSQLVASGLTKESSKEIKFDGFPAIRSAHSGDMNGLDAVMEHVFLVRDDIGFQIMVGGAAGATAKAAMNAALARISLLDPTPRVRLMDTKVAEQRGVDWDFHRGLYTHVGLGIAATAPKGWRIIIGEELTLMDTEAVLGYGSADGRYFMTVSGERVPFAGHEAHEDFHREMFWEDYYVESPQSIKASIRPTGRRAEIATDSENGMTYLIETGRFADASLFFTGWFPGADKKIYPGLFAAMDAVRIATPEELASAQRRLDARPDPSRSFDPALVGQDYSYYAGTLRLFGLGATWTLPAKGRWKVTGMPPTFDGSGAIVTMNSSSLGLTANLFRPVDTGTTSSIDGDHEAHASEYRWDEDEESPAPVRPTKIASRDGLTSTHAAEYGGGAHTTEVWTLPILDGEKSVTIVVTGYSDNVTAAKAEIKELLGGLRLGTEPLPRVEQSPGVFTSHAFGFSIDSRKSKADKTGEAKAFNNITDESLKAGMTVIDVGLASGSMAMFCTPAGPYGGPRSAEAKDTVMESMKAGLLNIGVSERLIGRGKSSKGKISGVTVDRIRLGSTRSGTDILVLQRGDLAYGLLLSGTVEQREARVRWFSLLD